MEERSELVRSRSYQLLNDTVPLQKVRSIPYSKTKIEKEVKYIDQENKHNEYILNQTQKYEYSFSSRIKISGF